MRGRTIALLVVLSALAAILVSAVTRRPLRVWQSNAEKAAIRALFAFQTAESDYAVRNGGFFDAPDCVFTPASCLPGYSGPPFLDREFDAAARAAGYRFTFHPGPSADAREGGAKPASPHGIHGYAFVATPQSPGWFGPRTVCVDSAARVCVSARRTIEASFGSCPIECAP